MRSTFPALLAALLVMAAGLQDARAQQGSDQCLQLEAQLAAIDRGGRKQQDPRQIAQAIDRQQRELDRTSSYAKGLGCGRRFFFSPDPPPECAGLTDRIRQMEVNLDRLSAQAAQASQGGGGDPRRRDLLFALARGQCGPQYRLVERKVQSPQQADRRGFFSMLFGGQSSEAPREETVLEPQLVEPPAPRQSSTFRTVCVRTCDGFFFPVSYATSRSAFNRDEAICHATCPGSEAKLFAYPNPGGQIEQAAAIDGEPYAKLENAFRYRKEFVAGCSCKPEGVSWAEALAGVEDKTVKKGDIVVDEQKAQEMSRPKTAAEMQAQTQAQARTKPQSTPRLAAPAAAPAPDDLPLDGPQSGQSPRSVPEDVIILDQPSQDRGAIERRPLDGPNVERDPR